MLQEVGASLVMAGHSERRHTFRETDREENLKVRAALKHRMTALLCIGETAEEKEYGVSIEALRMQLKVGLHKIDPRYAPNIWIAYEPVWSIGVNGIPATAEYAEGMHKAIKGTLREIFGEQGLQIPVLYGGSVNPQNADSLIVQPSIDGLFVGRAAWDAGRFNALIRSAMQALKDRPGA